MGIQASYWATGGILTVLAAALLQLLLPLLTGALFVIGAFLLKAALIAVAIVGLVIVVAIARKTSRRRRAAEGF